MKSTHLFFSFAFLRQPDTHLPQILFYILYPPLSWSSCSSLPFWIAVYEFDFFHSLYVAYPMESPVPYFCYKI
jgi:hypothetical protein